MLFVSKDYGNGIYGVTDSDDNVEERYHINDIRNYVSQGIRIRGINLNTDKVNVYPTYDDYCRSVLAHRKLMDEGCSFGGLKFSDDFSTIVNCDKKADSFRIPDFVVKIGVGAFSRSKLKSIVIPNSVKVIECNAFYKCDCLQSVKMADSVTEIGTKAFMYCSNLKTVELSNSLKKIDRYTFSECHSLESVVIPNSVKSIDDGAFINCKALNSLVIPDSVTEIIGSFAGCSNLPSVTIPNSVIRLGSSTFARCSKLTSIVIPDSVATIMDTVFYECRKLRDVTIAKSVTHIGSDVFMYCSKNLKVKCFSDYIASYCNRYKIKCEVL